MNWTEFDFKHAKLILEDLGIREETQSILQDLNTPLGRIVRPTPSDVILDTFGKRGWTREYQVSERSGNLRFDLYKDSVAIEVQLTDPADCYNDFLKFLLAYNVERIEVGIEIVYDDSVSGDNLPKLRKVKNDLEIFRRIMSCPVWVIGLKSK